MSGTRTPATAPAPAPAKTDLFAAGKQGYATYRIPGIVVTARGTILAYCEARKDGMGDWADIDVLLRRSTDGGQTWSRRRCLADAGKLAANNPVAVAARDGAVHFLYCVHYARCFSMRSDDDGQSFSKPVEITPAFEKFRRDYDWNVIATGPGHGIQLDSGRLLVPVWLSTGGRRHRPSCVASIYSDDGGKTWRRGEIVVRHSRRVPNPSETVAVQLADGRVLFNIRNESDRHRRLLSFSRDGATHWSKPVFHDQLVEPVCMASTVRLTRKPPADRSRILFANPDNLQASRARGPNRDRKNLTVRLSYDEGKTWPVKRTVEAGISGYSDLAGGGDGTIYCFYERGGFGDNHYKTRFLTLARFRLAWLSGGEDKQGAD